MPMPNPCVCVTSTPAASRSWLARKAGAQRTRSSLSTWARMLFAGAQNLMDETLKAYGRIDVLVNNVGGTIWIQPYHKYTEEQVHLELERTLYPTLWCCLAVLLHHDGAALRGHREPRLPVPSRS